MLIIRGEKQGIRIIYLEFSIYRCYQDHIKNILPIHLPELLLKAARKSSPLSKPLYAGYTEEEKIIMLSNSFQVA
jgi:hypothetical protein